MTSKGTLNLVSQDVNMHLTAVAGERAAARPAGGGLQNVLSIGKGGPVVPVIITETSHPDGNAGCRRTGEVEAG